MWKEKQRNKCRNNNNRFKKLKIKKKKKEVKLHQTAKARCRGRGLWKQLKKNVIGKKKQPLKSLIGFLSANKIDNYNRGGKMEKKKSKESNHNK